MSDARLIRISGALAEGRPRRGAALYEEARVGTRGLLGEVIRVEGDVGMLQVYEDTDGLGTGEPVRLTGGALTVDLGPGLLGSILDKGPLAVRYAIESAVRGETLGMEDALYLEAALFGMACGSEDMKEGTRAFLEKRKPEWKGR